MLFLCWVEKMLVISLRELYIFALLCRSCVWGRRLGDGGCLVRVLLNGRTDKARVVGMYACMYAGAK